MAEQNLISAEISPADKDEILKKLQEINAKLDFLTSLQPDDIKSVVKVGNNYMPFLDKAYNAVIANPEIMSGTFDLEEYKRDYALAKDLTPISAMASKLAQALENTVFAASSDAMVSSLEVYAAVKANKDRIAGLNVTANELSEFFKKTKKKKD